MTRAALLLLMVAIGAGGCGEGTTGGQSYADPCLRFKSCGDCTPIRGCGWCSSPRAPGVCLHDPIECPGPVFTWTWEPNSCTGGTGAGGTTGAPPPPPGADGGTTAMCRWPAEADTFTGGDGGQSGCLPSRGGNLCTGTSQYALTCYGNGTSPPTAPAAALQCTAVTTPTPGNVLFYCCPCSAN